MAGTETGFHVSYFHINFSVTKLETRLKAVKHQKTIRNHARSDSTQSMTLPVPCVENPFITEQNYHFVQHS